MTVLLLDRPLECEHCGARLGTKTPGGIYLVRNGEVVWVDDPFSRVRFGCYRCSHRLVLSGRLGRSRS